MPKKNAQKQEEKVVEQQSEVEVEAQAKPKAKGRGAKAAKNTKESAPAKPKAPRGKKAAVVSESVPAETTTSDSAVPKTRHVPTRETVEKEFDELIASVDEEINKLRETTAKSKGVKFLRTVNKRVKLLKNHTLRVSKQRNTTRRNNTNSGFLKPVQISKDLAKFTGWNQAELRSRVDVTKFICNYIKEHNLQDPQDRRKIRVEDDKDLKNLLKFDSKDKKPLTYYSLQTYLKSHFMPAAQDAQKSEPKSEVKVEAKVEPVVQKVEPAATPSGRPARNQKKGAVPAQ